MLHYKHWLFVAISATVREVAGSASPNIGKVTERDFKGERAIRHALVTKNLPVHSTVHKAYSTDVLEGHGFKTKSIERVLGIGKRWATQGSISRCVKKALGGPQEHQEFEPYEHDHPLVRLFRKPNGLYVAYDLWAYHQLFKGLTGEVHWWVIRNSFGMPVEIWVIPTHWMRLETDYLGRPISWAVQSPWGQLQHVPFDQVINFYDHSPLNLYEGVAATQAAGEWIDSYESQVRARLAMFKNGGAPAFHVLLGESYADPDEAFLNRFYAQWNARFQGEDNWNKPIITGPDIKIENSGVVPNDIPFEQGEVQGRDMILATYGVPKGVVGLEPTSDVSAYAPQRQFVRFKINPELKYIGEKVTEDLIRVTPNHEDGLFFFDDHVIDDPEQQLREIEARWSKGAMSPNQVRTSFGDEPWLHGGDDPVLNGNPVPWQTGTGDATDQKLEQSLRDQLGVPSGNGITGGYDPEKGGVGGHDDPYSNDGFNPDIEGDRLYSPPNDEDEGRGYVRKDEDEEDEGSLILNPTLRWYKTRTGDLEARGKHKWKIRRLEDGYELHMNGEQIDDAGAIGILKEVAEKSEAVESPVGDTVTKNGRFNGFHRNGEFAQ